MKSSGDHESTPLSRSLGLSMITVYGLGTIIGGGFYALTGKVAGHAGMLTPMAFLVAAGIALLNGFSFGELSARYPVSAGESQYVDRAFGRRWLSGVVGWTVIATGVVSAATMANAFAAFLRGFVDLPHGLVVCLMILSLGAVTAWGIKQSATVALVVTIIEVGGLVMVLVYGGSSLAELPNRWDELLPTAKLGDWAGLFLGAYLAFYSFVGFEDMVNVAEEVREPQRNLPIAILTAVIATAIVYVLVSLVVVLSVRQADLIKSDSPLSLVFGPWRFGSDSIRVIGLVAGLNGALVQLVMASRVAYGLARQQLAPTAFGRVNAFTRTPLQATAAVTVIVLVLSLCFPLEMLAKITTSGLLIVYALVNLALWSIKGRESEPPKGVPNYPRWLPLVAFAVCTGLLIFPLANLAFG